MLLNESSATEDNKFNCLEDSGHYDPLDSMGPYLQSEFKVMKKEKKVQEKVQGEKHKEKSEE